jgi:hypothetical protein
MFWFMLLALLSVGEGTTSERLISIQTAPTAIPTLIPARDLDLLPTFEALMTIDEDCILPCWWGFWPEETTVTEILTFLQETDFDRQWELSGTNMTLEEYLSLEEPFNLDFEDSYYIVGDSIQITFGVSRNQLRRIQLEFTRVFEWFSPKMERVALPRILTEIQSAPEIYISGRSTRSEYLFFVIYREAHMQFVYKFDFSADNLPEESVNRFCLNIDRTDEIDMQLNIQDENMIDITENEPRYEFDPYALHTTEQFLNVDLETFVEFFRENPDECLNISEYQD